MAELLPQAAWRDVLLDSVAVSALVGERIFPLLAKADTPRPYIVYRRIRAERAPGGGAYTLRGASGGVQVTIEATITADTYASGWAVAQACRKALSGKKVTSEIDGDSLLIQMATLDDESEDYEAAEGASEIRRLMITQDWTLTVALATS